MLHAVVPLTSPLFLTVEQRGFLFSDFLILHAMLYGKPRRERAVRRANAFQQGERHLRPLDNNGPETTPGPRWSCLCSGNGVGRRPHSLQPHLQSPHSKSQNNQPGQSPDTFPSNFHCRMCSFSG